MSHELATAPARQAQVLTGLLTAALLASIGHFTDNYVNYYDAYPQSDAIPAPPDTAVLLLWFVFTAAGVAGYVLFRRGARRQAVVRLAVYSGAGLGGLGHYATAAAFHMPWWRQAAVGADIACGVAIVVFIVWVMRTPVDRTELATTNAGAARCVDAPASRRSVK